MSCPRRQISGRRAAGYLDSRLCPNAQIHVPGIVKIVMLSVSGIRGRADPAKIHPLPRHRFREPHALIVHQGLQLGQPLGVQPDLCPAVPIVKLRIVQDHAAYG